MNTKFKAAGFLLALALLPAASHAAFVTTNQADMKVIFSQSSFGSNPIDVRFQPTVTITNTSLLNIDSIGKLNTLFGLSPVSAPGINMFFVDTVSVCSVPSPSPSIDGCATINGNDIVVASTAAADTTMFGGVTAGAILNAHEVGHNLGLNHNNECSPPTSNPANLMDCQLMGFDLISGQVTAILMNTGVLQSGPGGLFVDITPVLIVPVPLPGALPLMLAGLGVLAGVTRRRTSAPA